MLSLKSFALGTAVVGSTLAAVSFAAVPAHAALVGGIALTGSSDIVESGGPIPTTSTIKFGNVNISQASFDFLDITQPPQIIINDLVLTYTGTSNIYSTGAITPWINFGLQEINDVTANLTFNLNPSTFRRLSGALSSVLEFSDPQVTGTFVFNGQTIGVGFVSASETFFSSGYEITLGALNDTSTGVVPEPFTMLGAGAAVGLGAFFKRSSARKQEKDNKKA